MKLTVGPEHDRKEVEIVPYDEGLSAGVTDLYRSIFGSRSTDLFERRRRWQYEANPSCARLASYIQVALHAGRVVGHMGAYPMPLRYVDRVREAQCGADLMVDPAFKGLGTVLVKRYAAQTPGVGCGVHPAAQSIVSQFGGRPWAVSRTRYFLRLRDRGAWCRWLRRRIPARLAPAVSPAWTGWIPLGAPGGARAEPLDGPPLTRRDAPRPGSADIRELDRFGADYDALWAGFSKRVRFTIEKTAAYMNWRYVECPTMTPFRWGLYEAERLVAVVVGLRHPILDGARRPCGSEGELLELVADGASEGGLGALVAAAVAHLDRASVDTVSTTGLHPSLYPTLERLGFERRTSDRFANVLIFTEEDWRFVESFGDEDWYLTAGDGDALN